MSVQTETGVHKKYGAKMRIGCTESNFSTKSLGFHIKFLDTGLLLLMCCYSLLVRLNPKCINNRVWYIFRLCCVWNSIDWLKKEHLDCLWKLMHRQPKLHRLRMRKYFDSSQMMNFQPFTKLRPFWCDMAGT